MNIVKMTLALGLLAASAGITTAAYADTMNGAPCQAPADRTAQTQDDPACTTSQQQNGSGASQQ